MRLARYSPLVSSVFLHGRTPSPQQVSAQFAKDALRECEVSPPSDLQTTVPEKMDFRSEASSWTIHYLAEDIIGVCFDCDTGDDDYPPTFNHSTGFASQLRREFLGAGPGCTCTGMCVPGSLGVGAVANVRVGPSFCGGASRRKASDAHHIDSLHRSEVDRAMAVSCSLPACISQRRVVYRGRLVHL